MSEITHLLVLRLTDSLTTHMIDEVFDESKAAVVQSYRFQDNPVTNAITLYVTSGNPEEPKETDGRIDNDKMEDLGLNLPSGEIGGGHLWWRRGHVAVNCFMVKAKYDQVVAADVAKRVLGRAAYWVENTQVGDLRDEFGEQAIFVRTVESRFTESGGPENQYIWRGFIRWQALTERPT